MFAITIINSDVLINKKKKETTKKNVTHIKWNWRDSIIHNIKCEMYNY